jgi:tetraprenyl-beta-curcumene synthase
MTPRHASPHRTAAAFAAAGARYWSSAWPLAQGEIGQWRRRAAAIPDPILRSAALQNLDREGGNLEGAAAYAVLAERERRPALVRALVAFQAIYDYVDTLVELPDHADPDSARRLHQALSDTVTPACGPAANSDYYGDGLDDGGYLAALVDACRQSIATLPGHSSTAATAQGATGRMVEYQVLNHAAAHDALAAWAAGLEAPARPLLYWWERAAAAASSLVVFALLAHAATAVDVDGDAIADAYESIGALHVLLDSLADREQDAVSGDHSLVAHYTTAAQTADRLAAIATAGRTAALALPSGATHAAITSAMAGYYLASAEEPAAAAIAAALGPTTRPAIAILRIRHHAARPRPAR